jgi:hypothetical protein
MPGGDQLLYLYLAAIDDSSYAGNTYLNRSRRSLSKLLYQALEMTEISIEETPTTLVGMRTRLGVFCSLDAHDAQI